MKNRNIENNVDNSNNFQEDDRMIRVTNPSLGQAYEKFDRIAKDFGVPTWRLTDTIHNYANKIKGRNTYSNKLNLH